MSEFLRQVVSQPFGETIVTQQVPDTLPRDAERLQARYRPA
jgi:hypothetical protein